jgi:Flp pilus assembly protein TadG
MISSLKRSPGRQERGSVAIELAAVLPVLLLILVMPLFYARVFWYYSVAEKAAHDAARFLSSATQAEMRTLGDSGVEARVATIAQWIAATETEMLVPVMERRIILIQCGYGSGSSLSFVSCSDNVAPSVVRVYVSMRMYDDLFSEFTSALYPEEGLHLNSDITMRYVGN